MFITIEEHNEYHRMTNKMHEERIEYLQKENRELKKYKEIYNKNKKVSMDELRETIKDYTNKIQDWDLETDKFMFAVFKVLEQIKEILEHEKRPRLL